MNILTELRGRYWLQNGRIAATTEKIREFKNLPQGWHYGRGIPPSDATIENAIELNIEAANNGFTKTNAFPGIEGEIQFTIYPGETYLEFTLEINGSITFLYEENGEEKEYRENLSFDEAIQKISNFKEKLWASSGLFTNNIMTQIRGASRALLSNLPATAAESQVLIKTVPYRQVQVFASTSRSITWQLLVTRPSSGLSPFNYSLTNVASSNRQASPGTFAIMT